MVGVPQSGDTLVIDKTSGKADVKKLAADGSWTMIRDDAPNVSGGVAIARVYLAPDGHTVWYRREAEPDSVIRRFKP
jgi:hypothetical protein